MRDMDDTEIRITTEKESKQDIDQIWVVSTDVLSFHQRRQQTWHPPCFGKNVWKFAPSLNFRGIIAFLWPGLLFLSGKMLKTLRKCILAKIPSQLAWSQYVSGCFCVMFKPSKDQLIFIMSWKIKTSPLTMLVIWSFYNVGAVLFIYFVEQ